MQCELWLSAMLFSSLSAEDSITENEENRDPVHSENVSLEDATEE